MRIKIHMKSGTVFVFDDLNKTQIDDLENRIFHGRGGYITLTTDKSITKIKIDDVEVLDIEE